ncbi:MAG: hypothetical protein A2096_03325 [Spirochaetes bacterium GWF1_41_5]|nr:MAG: hypothetical protein A2096_03325 [Spirochaetes bacterium GWF1_41_5]HBE02878.1 hypothetical protein [Spirochaetia bacterium]
MTGFCPEKDILPLYSKNLRRHAKAAAECAAKISRAHKLDPEKARNAALLHDFAKALPAEELDFSRKKYLHGRSFPDFKTEHGFLTAAILSGRYNVRDQQMLDAIAHHTLGTETENPYLLVLYISDYASHLKKKDTNGIIKLARKSLWQAALYTAGKKLIYVIKGEKHLYPEGVGFYNWLRTRCLKYDL